MNRQIFKKITILLLVVFATFFSLKTKINAVTTYKAGGLIPFRYSYYEGQGNGCRDGEKAEKSRNVRRGCGIKSFLQAASFRMYS